MSNGINFPLQFADEYARCYLADLLPLCERAEIVGSIRRKKPVVHDIEFLIIPKADPITDLFGGIVAEESHIEKNMIRLASCWGAVILKGSGPVHKKLQLAEGIILEINISTPERWPVEMVVKTGPSEFSRKCVTRRKYGGYLPSWAVVKNEWRVYAEDSGDLVPMAGERAFLEFLGLGWVEPEDRHEGLKCLA